MNDKEKADWLKVLQAKEKELETAIALKESFLETERLRKEIREITSKINKAYVVVDSKVSAKLTQDQICSARAFTQYRDPKLFEEDVSTKLPDNCIPPTLLRGNNGQKSYPSQKTEFDEKYSLNVPKIATSTPVEKDTKPSPSSHIEDLKKLDLATIEKPTPEIKVNTPIREQIEQMKKEVLEEVEEDTLAKYFSEPDNEEDFNATIDQGLLRLKEIVDELEGKIIQYFIHKTEQGEGEQTLFVSAVNGNSSPHNPLAKSGEDDEMPNPVIMKGLSLKDALDPIPRFNGENIPLSQFIDGCYEAKKIVLEDFDVELAKLIRMPLHGDALNAARTETFANMRSVTDFLEKTFGSAKTYFDLTGEIAKVRQKSNEPVIVYANHLKEIEAEIKKAA